MLFRKLYDFLKVNIQNVRVRGLYRGDEDRDTPCSVAWGVLSLSLNISDQ